MKFEKYLKRDWESLIKEINVFQNTNGFCAPNKDEEM